MKKTSLSRFILMLIASIVTVLFLSSSIWVTLPQFPGKVKSVGDIAAYDDSNYIVSIERNNNITRRGGQEFYITSDYGNTWDSVYSTVKTLSDLEWNLNTGAQFQYVGKDSIYAYNVLEKRLLCFYKTLDNGKTWDTTMFDDVGPVRWLLGMYFKNPMEGIIALQGQYMLRTNDGGETWSLDTLPQFDEPGVPDYYRVTDISAIKDTVLVSLADENASENSIYWKKLLFSTDFGKTWEIIDDTADTVSIIADLGELRSADEWWVFGQASYDYNKVGHIVIKKTTDRGKTWQFIDKGGEIFYGIATHLHFFDENHIRFGTSRYAYYSTDNGETWEKEHGQEDNYFGSHYVAYPSFDRGITIHYFGHLYRLEDGPMSVSESNADIQSTTLIYPNPTAEVIYLNNLDAGEYRDYEIINLEGIKVQEGGLRANSVRVDKLPAGVYQLILTGENKAPQVKKFVKR